MKASGKQLGGDTPAALTLTRAASDKLTTNLTLSPAERRRLTSVSGRRITVDAREQELQTDESMNAIAAERKR
jgi:hypothetical protein